MVQYQDQPTLDRTLAAVADPNRRAIVDRLSSGDATISELAEAAGMSLTGMKKHVRILEEAELVRTEKRGRTRHCELGPRRLEDVSQWIDAYRRSWEERFERLDLILEQKQRQKKEGNGS